MLLTYHLPLLSPATDFCSRQGMIEFIALDSSDGEVEIVTAGADGFVRRWRLAELSRLLAAAPEDEVREWSPLSLWLRLPTPNESASRRGSPFATGVQSGNGPIHGGTYLRGREGTQMTLSRCVTIGLCTRGRALHANLCNSRRLRTCSAATTIG